MALEMVYHINMVITVRQTLLLRIVVVVEEAASSAGGGGGDEDKIIGDRGSSEASLS